MIQLKIYLIRGYYEWWCCRCKEKMREEKVAGQRRESGGSKLYVVILSRVERLSAAEDSLRRGGAHCASCYEIWRLGRFHSTLAGTIALPPLPQHRGLKGSKGAGEGGRTRGKLRERDERSSVDALRGEGTRARVRGKDGRKVEKRMRAAWRGWSEGRRTKEKLGKEWKEWRGKTQQTQKRKQAIKYTKGKIIKNILVNNKIKKWSLKTSDWISLSSKAS